MQSILFINTFFEEELAASTTFSIYDYLQKHPLYFQLQYLACLINKADEIPCLSYPPTQEYLLTLRNLGFKTSDIHLLSDPPLVQGAVSSWGASASLQKWSQEKNYSYITPPLDLVQQIQSKKFTFDFFPQLEDSAFITSAESLSKWWHSFRGPKVLKSLYGSSGRGHFVSYLPQNEFAKALAFFNQHQSVIAQPWAERILDFSSQWNIEKDSIFYIGSTICENSSRGIYRKSTSGPDEMLFRDYLDFFNEHIVYAKKAAHQLLCIGFFGHVGFDAMIYRHPLTSRPTLIPVLEINARKTMGWVCVQINQKLYPDRCSSISYEPMQKDGKHLLPSLQGSHVLKKQLILKA